MRLANFNKMVIGLQLLITALHVESIPYSICLTS